MQKWFSNVCSRYADRILVRPSFKYKDLTALSEKKKKDLCKLGVKRGDRILLSEHNSVDFLGKLRAIWELEGTPCLVSPKLHSEKKEHCKRLLLTSKVPPIPEALLMLTSGTSAKSPKGVRLSHANIMTHISMLRGHISSEMFNENDKTLSFLPWTHCYGLMGECFSVMDRGASMSILTKHAQEQFRFPTFFKDLQLCQPTILFVVPYLLEVIIRRDRQLRKLITHRHIRRTFWFGGNLRYIVSGGAHLKPEIRKAFFNELDVEVIQGYGCSEMSPMVSLQKGFDLMDSSVGKLLPNIQIHIRENEIWVNGPNRFVGYVGEEELFMSQFYNTGDMGYVKNENLYLTGRSSNMLKLGNGKFLDVHDIEKMLQETIPKCQDVCIWQGDDKKFYGLVHVLDLPSKVKKHMLIETYKCFEEEIHVMIQKTSFLSPINGTLTAKGEMCRPIIKSTYEHLLKNYFKEE